jgi:hypothetical protein
MTLITDSTIGTEDVQRQAFLVALDHFNDALIAIASKWDINDEALALRLGVEYVPTVLEPIPVENFYEGHVPSLINAPVDKYPNFAVMVFRATPGAENDLMDHGDLYRDSLVIDVMVKGQNEQEVNRRAHRTAEAANLCIRSNPTLYGVVDGLDTAPSLDISDVFVRRDKEKGHYGQTWFWQGARLSYGVRKTATLASSIGGFMPSAGIDQS